MNNTPLDPIDQRLITLLRDNGRTPTTTLARKMGLSRTTVQNRLSRLERSGVIAGYSIRLSEAHESGGVHAYIMVSVKPKSAARVASEVRKLAAVRSLEAVSGQFDFIAVGTATSMPLMDQLIDAIGAIEGVDRTISSIVLSRKFSR